MAGPSIGIGRARRGLVELGEARDVRAEDRGRVSLQRSLPPLPDPPQPRAQLGHRPDTGERRPGGSRAVAARAGRARSWTGIADGGGERVEQLLHRGGPIGGHHQDAAIRVHDHHLLHAVRARSDRHRTRPCNPALSCSERRPDHHVAAGDPWPGPGPSACQVPTSSQAKSPGTTATASDALQQPDVDRHRDDVAEEAAPRRRARARAGRARPRAYGSRPRPAAVRRPGEEPAVPQRARRHEVERGGRIGLLGEARDPAGSPASSGAPGTM